MFKPNEIRGRAAFLWLVGTLAGVFAGVGPWWLWIVCVLGLALAWDGDRFAREIEANPGDWAQ